MIPQQQGSGFDPHYFITDHLGNVRVMFTAIDDSVQIVQENHYYPFGMKMGGLSYMAQENNLLYQGKELQKDYKLNWYDFGARMYDNQIGRWHMVDPINQNRSPYVAMGNNPMTMIDPNGMYYSPGRRTSMLRDMRNRKRMLDSYIAPMEFISGDLEQHPEVNVWDGFGASPGGFTRSKANYLLAKAEKLLKKISGKESTEADAYKEEFRDLVDVQEDLKELGIILDIETGLSNDIDGEDGDWDLNSDGVMTIDEAFNWWKNGNGQNIRIQLSSIDLSSITPGSFPDGVGSVESFNLILRGNIRDGLVHGTISLRLYPDNTVKAFDDEYNFDFKPWLSFPIRNTLNFIGKTIHGSGKSFEIDFIGSGTISPSPTITDWYIRTGGIR